MGWVYNADNPDPDSHAARIIGLCLTFATLACIAVMFRFHVRIFVKKSLWVDDFAALFSALMGMAYAGLAVAQTRWGLGLHMDYFPPENNVPFSQMQYAGGPIYTLALLGFKISLLASYLRIGGFVHSYRMVIYAAIAACVCNQIIFTFVLSFGCNPVAKQWDPSIAGSCINTVSSYYGLAGTSLVFDVIIIALPLPILARLQLKLRQKVMLGVLFGLGFFVTIIQIIRIFTISNLATYTDSEPIIIWSTVETSLGVMISCVPTYGPYFRALAVNISSYRRRATQATGQTYDRSYGQSYGVSLSPNTKTGSRVYDNSVPMAGVVGAGNQMGANSSEENILAAARESDEQAAVQPRIHIATEVRVESGPREGR
ncbi:hypothetical protein BJX99DRAFT_253476 [Aspergillus californicus]